MDTTFHDAQPPLMTAADHADVPPRSDYDLVGQITLAGTDMNRVVDPKYNWREYTGSNDPAYIHKRNEILAARDEEVDHYVVTRRRYWLMQKVFNPGGDEQQIITKTVGYTDHESHVVEQTHSAVERIAADLAIDLSPGADVAPGDTPPPVPPAAMAEDDDGNGGNGGGGNGGGGGGSSIDLHFSKEMTDSLHITDTDDQTFHEETTTTTQVSLKAATTYVYWQMIAECILERVPKATPKQSVLVYTTSGAMDDVYIDSYPQDGDMQGENR